MPTQGQDWDLTANIPDVPPTLLHLFGELEKSVEVKFQLGRRRARGWAKGEAGTKAPGQGRAESSRAES